jgi:hypothetical protein
MRAMRAEEFSGYEGLKLVDLPKLAVSDEKALLRTTAVGVTMGWRVSSWVATESRQVRSKRRRR